MPYLIELPKSEREKGFVIEMPQDAMEAVKSQYTADLRKYNPTTDMTGGQKFLAGVGHGMVQIPRSIGQLTGLYSQEQIDQAKKLDEALMATPQGGLGSFVGQLAVGAALPAKIPMISNPIANRAITGATFGALQPTATGESRGTNMLLGAGAGVALPPLIGALGRTVAAGAKKVAPGLSAEISQVVQSGANAISSAKQSAIAKYPVLGTEVDPAAIVSRLRSTTAPAPVVIQPDAMPNPTNPQAISMAQEGAAKIGVDWSQLPEMVQRKMAADADEALRLGADLTPDQLAIKSILESQGFKPTRALLTGSSEDFSTENSLRLHPEGAGLRQIDIENNQNLERQILAKGAPGVSALPTPEFGQTIRKGLSAEKAVSENRVGNLYGAAAKNEGQITTNADELAAMLKSPASFAVTKVDSPVREYLRTIGKEDVFFPKKNTVQAQNIPKELTMQELATLRQIVNSKWENVDNATQAQLNQIRGVLNKMEANPNEPAPLYNKARISRIVQGEKWEQPLLDKVFAQDKGYKGVYRLDNKDLFDATMRHTSVEEFQPLWARMNQQQRDLTRSQLAKEMRDEVFSNMQLNAGQNRLEVGSPAKMIRYIDNVGYDKLKVVFGKQKADELMLLQKSWKNISSSPPGTKSQGSAPEIARLYRLTMNVIGDMGGSIPLVGKYISKAAGGATKAAEAEAEAATRALNANKAIDPMYDARMRTLGALNDLSAQRAVDARMRTLGALNDLSAQRAVDARALQNQRIQRPVNAGIFTLQDYINSLNSQEANQ